MSADSITPSSKACRPPAISAPTSSTAGTPTRLRQEATFQRCYVPAFKYQAERPATGGGRPGVYGDPDWMSSHVYRDIAGYYDALRPSKQIPGWAYHPTRDTEYAHPGQAHVQGVVENGARACARSSSTKRTTRPASPGRRRTVPGEIAEAGSVPCSTTRRPGSSNELVSGLRPARVARTAKNTWAACRRR